MEDREQIEAIEERIMAGFAAGDADAIAAQYTEDALLLPQDSPPVQGRAAIAENYRPVLEEFDMRLRTRVEEVEVAGAWAWLRGQFEHTSTSKADGTVTEHRGKYLAVARRDPDGVWRFHRDAFSLDGPA
jgi:uncharacterized protein (TIGR02246 family)